MCEFEIDHIHHHIELIRVADGSLILPVQLNITIILTEYLYRPLTQEISNSFKFRRVGPARWLLDALLQLVRNARFLPASCPVQRPVQLK